MGPLPSEMPLLPAAAVAVAVFAAVTALYE